MLHLLPLPSTITSSSTEELLAQAPLQPLPERWNNSPIQSTPCAAQLAISPTHIGFIGEIQLPPQQNSRQNSFIEGLWKATVLELFIGNSATGEYFEFHLAPWGNWWAGAFSCYRSPRDFAVGELNPFFAQQQTAEGWKACGIFSRVALDFLAPADSPLAANLCGIINEDQTPRFFSLNEPTTETPDFHRTELLQPLPA